MFRKCEDINIQTTFILRVTVVLHSASNAFTTCGQRGDALCNQSQCPDSTVRFRQCCQPRPHQCRPDLFWNFCFARASCTPPPTIQLRHGELRRLLMNERPAVQLQRTFRFPLKDLGGQLSELDLRSLVLQVAQSLQNLEPHMPPSSTDGLVKLPQVAFPVSLRLRCSEWCPWSPPHATTPGDLRRTVRIFQNAQLSRPSLVARRLAEQPKWQQNCRISKRKPSVTGSRRWTASCTAGVRDNSATP